MSPVDHRRYLTKPEIRQLIQSTQAYALFDLQKGRTTWPQTWMLVDMALQTGLRVSEMAMLKVEDFDPKRGALTVHRLKRKKPLKETLPLSKDFTKRVKEFLVWKDLKEDGVDPETSLFVGKRGPMTSSGLQRMWKAAIKAAGLPVHISIHAARHTYATHLLQKTGNLRLVQRQLGHSSPVTTANMYCGVDFEASQKALTDLY